MRHLLGAVDQDLDNVSRWFSFLCQDFHVDWTVCQLWVGFCQLPTVLIHLNALLKVGTFWSITIVEEYVLHSGVLFLSWLDIILYHNLYYLIRCCQSDLPSTPAARQAAGGVSVWTTKDVQRSPRSEKSTRSKDQRWTTGLCGGEVKADCGHHSLRWRGRHSCCHFWNWCWWVLLYY